MEFHFEESLKKTYRIETPERIATPRLVLFQAELECNITKIRRSLKEIAPDYGLHALWPHVKTHKSHWVVEKLLQVGIGGFKATPNEVEMLVKAGAKSIFVAYPLLPPDVEKLGRLITENREIRFYVQISQHDHVEHLLAAAHGVNIKWSYLLDLDVGMHRTGMAPENAMAFYNSLPLTPQLQFAGLHAYDGHNHSQELEKRRIESRCTTKLIVNAIQQFEHAAITVPRVVVGGTPSFLTDLECLAPLGLSTKVYLSPGTWVYNDTQTNEILPGKFHLAAFILAQVIDKGRANTATLNLGYKRWSIDQGPIDCFSVSGMQAVRWSEEHTVVTYPENMKVNIGDYILIAPRHVCSTVNLWEQMAIIGPDGRIENIAMPIHGRNR